MASLRFVVVAAVLASVAADFTAHEKLKEKLQTADSECSSEKKCGQLCMFKYLGILDKDGRYVEHKAAETMAIMIYEGILNQEQVNKIAKICNSVNEHIATGCERGNQVNECIDNETYKVIGKRVQ